MAGPGFTSLFGGNNIFQAQPSFLSLNPLATNVALSWPIEQSFATPNVADIIEVSATVPGLTISLDDARQTTTGYTTLFNNVGANTFEVLDNLGNTLLTVASGQVWQIYLADNTTQQGTWRIFQYGAGASNANAAALAGAGLKAIGTTLNETMLVDIINVNTNITAGNLAQIVEWQGGVGSVGLPAPVAVGANWFVALKNNGTGNVTVTPAAGQIDGIASLVFPPDSSAFIICDGTNYITLGFGQQLNSVFDFIQISLTPPGTGAVVLAGAQLNRVSYRFVGALTGNVNVVVPATIQQYWVDNETTGAFTLTISSSGGGSSTQVAQGQRNILYCDSVNVVPAITFGSTGFASGTAAAPSITFSADPTSGLFSPAAGSLGLSAGGVLALKLTAGQALFTSGSAGNPSVTFVGDNTTGMFRGGAGIIGFASAGVNVFQLNLNGQADFTSGAVTNPSVTFFADGSTGMFLPSAGNLGFTAGGGLSKMVLGGNLSITPQVNQTGIVLNTPATAIANEAAFFLDTIFHSVGASTGTFTTANKPGANNGIISWIQVALSGGISGWVPVVGN